MCSHSHSQYLHTPAATSFIAESGPTTTHAAATHIAVIAAVMSGATIAVKRSVTVAAAQDAVINRNRD